MKTAICLATAIVLGLTTKAQYYYKDLVIPTRSSELMKLYKAQQIHSVILHSYEGSGSPTEGFEGEQVIDNNYSTITTRTNSQVAGSSELTTFYDASGKIIRTVDTTDGSSSVNTYVYNGQQLTSVTNVSISTGQSREEEAHVWSYNAAGKPEKMVKVKNSIDSTYYSFVPDEKSNVGEENGRRKSDVLPSVYYYYDDKGRLTDIVRYNKKAGRLLPDYMFEYNDKNQLTAMIVVPEGSDDYQRWIYEYDERGLKTKETCFNKRKQMLGRIEYAYSK
jgi:hypothetical protein